MSEFLKVVYFGVIATGQKTNILLKKQDFFIAKLRRLYVRLSNINLNTILFQV